MKRELIQSASAFQLPDSIRCPSHNIMNMT